MFLFSKPTSMVQPDEALPGRDEQMPVPAAHEVLGTPIAPPEFAAPRHLRPAASAKNVTILGERVHQVGIFGLMGAERSDHVVEVFRA